jgi:phthalate 4,5-cis-dihydrodiol dehydrogenase
MTGAWDERRPVVAAYSAFLAFEDGVAATAVTSSYDHFSTADLALKRPEGNAAANREQAQARRALKESADEAAMRRPQAAIIAGAIAPARGGGRGDAWPGFGPMIVSCDRADIVLSGEGIVVCGDESREVRPFPTGPVGSADVVNQMYEAITFNRPLVFDGAWGRATLEVMLAVLQSGREQREVRLECQVALRERNATT